MYNQEQVKDFLKNHLFPHKEERDGVILRLQKAAPRAEACGVGLRQTLGVGSAELQSRGKGHRPKLHSSEGEVLGEGALRGQGPEDRG